MIVEQVVTSLEMTSPDQLIPAPLREVTLTTWQGTADQLALLHEEIAAPHRWPSLAWPAEEWRRRMTAENLRWQAFTLGQEVIGLLELEVRDEFDVEITIFGLRPAWQGQGLGSAALTLAARSAWRGLGDSPEPVRRIWLHTSTRDGPHALNNYLRRGFMVFNQETMTEVIPDLR